MHDEDAESLLSKLICFKSIYVVNFDKNDRSLPLCLLKKIFDLSMSHYNSIFIYLYGILTCCTLPVTVASAESSFNVMAKVKNVLRNAMRQESLASLGVLAAESEIA